MSHASSSGSQPFEPSISALWSTTEPHHTNPPATTEQPNFSNPHSISGAINLSGTDPTPENEWDWILKKLESIAETFRGVTLQKQTWLPQDLGVLKENTNVSINQSQKKATFNSYLTKILSIQSTFDDSRGPDPLGTEPIEPPVESGKIDARRASRRTQDVKNPVSNGEDDKPTKKQKLLKATCLGSPNLMTPITYSNLLRTSFLLWHMLTMLFPFTFHLWLDRRLPQGKHAFYICIPHFYITIYMCSPHG